MLLITEFTDAVGWLVGWKEGIDEVSELDEGIPDGTPLGTDDESALDGRLVASPSVGIAVGIDDG